MRIGDKVKHKDQDIIGVIVNKYDDKVVIQESDNQDEETILVYRTKELIKQ